MTVSRPFGVRRASFVGMATTVERRTTTDVV
jgi:hypothetical protein